METRSASKRKATFKSTGVVTRRQRLELEGRGTATPKNHKAPQQTKKKIISIEPQEPTNYLDTLPDVALRVLYKYLPVEDTLNTYSVSSRTKAFATEKSIWKDKILYISDVHKLREYRWIIQQCPLLSAVCFSIDDVQDNHYNFIDSVVRILLKYMNDLHYLNAGSIHFHNFFNIFRKFKNLQRVEVGVKFFELPFLLKYLESCTKLRELNLNFITKTLGPFEGIREFWKNSVTKNLTDSFPSLTNLDMPVLQRSLEIEDMIQILEKKKDQLLHLKFILNKTALLQVLDVISSCVRLNLDLTVTTGVIFNIDQLKLLKSLKLAMTIKEENVRELNYLLSGIPMLNVKALQICLIFNSKNTIKGDFLRELIIKFPKLQELELVGFPCKDIDDQLCNICNLTELKNLKLCNLRFLTSYGLSHLAQCTSLKELHLWNIKMNKHAVVNVSKCIKMESLTIKGKLPKQIRHSVKKLCSERNITLKLKV